jgi:catechol 2,3-dioxygenase-like lactoylglutathione lyase family enzyme
MFANTKAYSGLAVNDLKAAREFYGETLGVRTSEEYGLMWLHLAGGRDTPVYQQPELMPASYTILNFAGRLAWRAERWAWVAFFTGIALAMAVVAVLGLPS